MNILHIIIGLNMGGAETSLFKLVTSSKSKNFKHIIISLTSLGIYGSLLKQQGYIVYNLNLKNVFSLPFVIFKLIRLFLIIKPDVVQTWMYHADLLGGLIAKLFNVKKILWCIRCTHVPIGSKSTFLLMKICAYISNFIPTYIICVAESSKESHIVYGYDSKKIIVIPNGFTVQSEVNPYKSNNYFGNNVFNNHIIVCSVGRFHPDKGIDILINSANKVLKTNKNVHFVLAGHGCDNNNLLLINLLKVNNVLEHFTLLGQINNVPSLLKSVDVFCLPSRTEGFPNVLAEAMSCGVPCVATNSGDAQILLGDNFQTVQVDSVAGLTNGLLNMVNETSEQRAFIGNSCFKRIEQYFSLSSVTNKYHILYRE